MNAVFSRVVKSIRFPLAAMVVLWHTPLFASMDFSQPVYSQGVAPFLYIFLSCTITYAAVPAFFFVSGFFFFKGIDSSWRWPLYGIKLKKRVRSLFVPYVLWILVYLVLNCMAGRIIRQPVCEWGGAFL